MDTLGPAEGDEGAQEAPPPLADTSLTQDDTSYIPNNRIPDCSSAALYANVWHIERTAAGLCLHAAESKPGIVPL